MSMKQLSGLDATFLYLETPEMPMHVGALHLFELPAGYKGHFVTQLRKHIASRLSVAPVLRRKLWWMPLNLANPAWVDAEPDLAKHIVEVKLPANARNNDGLAALEAQVGALHPVLLDRKRPLWKMHVFEGLAPGANGHKRVALYTQLHHAAVDGQAAVALANAILDLTPTPRAADAKASRRRKVFQVNMTEMLRAALGNQIAQVSRIVRDLPATLGTLGGAARKALGKTSLLGGKKGVGNVTLAPHTPFNVSVSAGRSFAAVTLPLRELKALGRAHDATINDMVLMLCSTALRRYLGKKRMLPKKSLVAAVPINLREAGDNSPDNQASMSLVSLGTHIADTGKRLAHIRAAAASMKSTMGSVRSILPTDFPSIGMPWLMEAATALYGRARLADKITQVANVVISNVPGPPVPLYLAGALMLTNYPTSIVLHGLALNITVQSYDQSLDFGLIADAAAVPDVKALAEAIAIAFDDLRALPLPHEHDEERDGPKVTLVSRATKSFTGAVGNVLPKMAKGLVDAAMGQVVSQAVAQVTRRPKAPAKKARAR